jgi:hypothetical protein
MKTKHILTVALAACSLTFTSCELDFEPESEIKGDAVSSESFERMMFPMYNTYWFDFNDKFYYGLGDGMAYNLLAPGSAYINPYNNLSVTGDTDGLETAWNSLYVVIQQANKVMIDIKNSSATEEEKKPYLAECRFMRGVAYWHLVSLWENVILCEDPTALIINPNVPVNTQQDGYTFAIRDMEYAAKYLPETSNRVNKYSAYGMLSRFYLAYSGLSESIKSGNNNNCKTRDVYYLDLAKKAAEKVIHSSNFQLVPNYADLFLVDNNSGIIKSPEGVFILQFANGTQEYGNNNSQQRFFAYTSEITGGNAWGGYSYCPWNMISEYEPEDSIRRKATWMGYGDTYWELNRGGGGFTYNANLVGEASTQLNIKKGVTGKPSDFPAIGVDNSGFSTYMMRLAEVYLNYAEAILGNDASTSDATALQYFNAVRTRAGLDPEKESINWEKIRHERRVEFCMEGRYWYDLVARSYYERQEVINYLNGQKRGERPPYLFTAPNDARIDEERDVQTVSVGTATEATFRLPYPKGDLIMNPKMNETPVSYDFSSWEVIELF